MYPNAVYCMHLDISSERGDESQWYVLGGFPGVCVGGSLNLDLGRCGGPRVKGQGSMNLDLGHCCSPGVTLSGPGSLLRS